MKKFHYALVLILGGCTAPEQARHALEGQGMKNVDITGYRFFGCGEEHIHTGFTATGPTGQHVEGVVCSGILKGATIRYD